MSAYSKGESAVLPIDLLQQGCAARQEPVEGLHGKRLLIVGRRSYIGGPLTRYALARGAEVVAVSSDECNLLRREDVVRFFRSLGDQAWDMIFLAVINKPFGTSYESFLENVQMVRHLIEGQRSGTLRSIIYFSSVDVYGRDPALPITEASPINPDSWYAMAKYTCEWMLRSMGEVRCPVTILRVPGIYGPADHDRSVIGQMVSSIRAEGRVTIRGAGQQLRDHVWLDDLCRLIEALLPLQYNGVLNVATGRSYRLIEIAKLVGEVLGRAFQIVHEPPEPSREFDLIFNPSLLKRLLPSYELHNLDTGIRSYLTPALANE